MKYPGKLVLLGHPVSHSISPAIHNAALEAAGIDVRYEAVDVAPSDLASVLQRLREEKAAGNVTAPHKLAVAAQMNRTSEIATRAGAVNTFRTTDDGELIGHNTDVPGFNALIADVLGGRPANAKVAILGAGGGARAVLTALEGWNNATAKLYARNIENAKELKARFPVVTGVDSITQQDTIECHLVVNATSVGVSNDEEPIDLSRIPPQAAVIDLVYRPQETAWVRHARAQGFRTSDGLPMLVEQAALSFETWFGRPPDRSVMWNAASKAAGRA